jgi:hypothetical protein
MIERSIGAWAMSLFVLDAILWIFGIRGHIPQNDGFPAGRGQSSFAANTATLMRVLAAAVISVVVLSLALWAAVWLAIKLL